MTSTSRQPWHLATALAAMATCALHGCTKVDIVDVGATFTVADATWFEEERTLFFFYRIDAQQGLGENSRVEVAWVTDDVTQSFAVLNELPQVHTHLPVDCGPYTLCGSGSVKVEKPPRAVQLQLRYHKDGALVRQAEVTFNSVAIGAPSTNRSLVVYGVFDEPNQHVQWRARHQFPTLRNEQVQALGLRRHLELTAPAYGDVGAPFADNPYGYGFTPQCPSTLTALGWPLVQTDERAVFDANTMPLAASAAPIVCAQATVTDANGTFTTAALALKNPEVKPAFPLLRSPIRDATPIKYLLRPCNRVISQVHQEMQVQRLLAIGSPEICIDDWQFDPMFVTDLAARWRADVDRVRKDGNDMVLLVALHHDDGTGALAEKLEQAFELLLPTERDQSSPHVAGAFLFDSLAHKIARPELRRLVLWCPAQVNPLDLDSLDGASARDCALQPDFPDIGLGPFTFSTLPILPTRAQYETFIGKYSRDQAGSMRELTFRAPQRTPQSENIPLGDFGLATFFNNESITASPTDAFSFCGAESGDGVLQVVFRIPGIDGAFSLQQLPQAHSLVPQPRYALGLAWDFPFLTHMTYQVTLAGALNAFGLTLPFGISNSSEEYKGKPNWERDSVPLDKVLLQCARFCTHPTFDSAGVYNVLAPFNPTFLDQCYRPVFPSVGDGGFPIDP